MLIKNTVYEMKAKTLSEKEYKLLLNRIDGGNKNLRLRNRTIMILSYKLGLRAKELASLTVGDVYQDNKILTLLNLSKEQTKGEKQRELSLENKIVSNQLAEWITSLQEETPQRLFNADLPLFLTQKRSVFSAGRMAECMKGIYKNAGKEFDNCSSHSGRRTFITNFANKGIDLNSIRVLAGHTSVQTTQIYIDENPVMLANIMKQA